MGRVIRRQRPEDVSKVRREAVMRRWNGVARRRTRTVRVDEGAALRLQNVARRKEVSQVELATRFIVEGLDRFEQS